MSQRARRYGPPIHPKAAPSRAGRAELARAAIAASLDVDDCSASETACAVADAWREFSSVSGGTRASRNAWDVRPYEAWEPLRLALDALELQTRGSALRKVRP